MLYNLFVDWNSIAKLSECFLVVVVDVRRLLLLLVLVQFGCYSWTVFGVHGRGPYKLYGARAKGVKGGRVEGGF